MDIQSENALCNAFKLIETCNISEASKLLEAALPLDLDDSNIIFSIKCCSFWIDTLNSISGLSSFEQGETLLNQWKQFVYITRREKEKNEKTVYSFRKGIFSLALECYSKAADEKDSRLKSEILRKTGLCYKKLGSYEIALKLLKDANCTLPGQAAVVAEVADCYALCGETKNAKMLFREAFYIDAKKIDFSFLDSPMIKALIAKVEELGYTGEILQEWVAVYGVILDVFTVKRILRAQEVIHLRQEIFARESEMKDPGSNKDAIKPRLLNLYFWLIDYYLSSKEKSSKLSEIMLKMKILDPKIHDLYRYGNL
ncbi:hypothetical protein [Treponema sp.]|uniref:hypothetical protein n=1 Tax=Treponema sp. TaxID=166 RepID=UPI003EFBC1E3